MAAVITICNIFQQMFMNVLISGPLHRCRTHFQVLKYETDVDFATETTPAWNLNSYSMVQTVPAAHTYVNNQDPNIVANNYTFSFSKAKKGTAFIAYCFSFLSQSIEYYAIIFIICSPFLLTDKGTVYYVGCVAVRF